MCRLFLFQFEHTTSRLLTRNVFSDNVIRNRYRKTAKIVYLCHNQNLLTPNKVSLLLMLPRQRGYPYQPSHASSTIKNMSRKRREIGSIRPLSSLDMYLICKHDSYAVQPAKRLPFTIQSNLLTNS